MSNTPNKSTPEPESTVFHGSILNILICIIVYQRGQYHHATYQKKVKTTTTTTNNNNKHLTVSTSQIKYQDMIYPSATIEEQIDLRLASSNNPTIVMELDLDGNIRYLSKNWEYIVGTNIKKIVNRHISKIIIGNNDDDSQVFNIAIDAMTREDISYKVKFITATNHTQRNKDGEEVYNDLNDLIIKSVSR